jgi:hypothetical protein
MAPFEVAAASEEAATVAGVDAYSPGSRVRFD